MPSALPTGRDLLRRDRLRRILCRFLQNVLRQHFLPGGSNVLHGHKRTEILQCDRGYLLREQFVHIKPEVLHDVFHAVLCDQDLHLLREHVLHVEPDVLRQ